MPINLRFVSALLLTASFGYCRAADIVVNALDDPGANPGICSLDEALASALGNITIGGCVAGDAGAEDRVLLDASLFAGDSARATLSWDSELTVSGGSLALLAPSGARLELQAGAGSHRAFRLQQLEGEHFTLSGIELTGFGGDEGGASMAQGGGAILFDGAGALRLQDCRFEANSARALGGAIAIVGAADRQLDIDRCEFIDNRVGKSASFISGNGGAIGGRHPRSQQIRIEDSLFRGNQQQASSSSVSGGGALLFSGPPAVDADALAQSSLTIRGTRFEDNQAMLRGGAIWLPNLRTLDVGVEAWQVVIEGSVFENNEALTETEDDSGEGGALWIDGSWHGLDHLTVARNAFFGNSAVVSGAVNVDNAVNVDASNNLFVDNQASDGVGALRIANASNAPAVEVQVIANSFTGNSSVLDGSAFWFALEAASDSGWFAGNLVSRPAAQALSIDTCVWTGNTQAWSYDNSLHDDPGVSCNFGFDAHYRANLLLALEPVDAGAHQQRLVPQPGSPAIDAWNAGDCLDADAQPLDVDLTGVRQVGGVPLDGDGNDTHLCDLGAVEVGSLPPAAEPDIFRDGFEQPVAVSTLQSVR